MWRDVLSRSAWLAGGSAVGRLLPYAVLIALGRRLPAAEFASLAVCFAWSGVAANLSTSGLATVAAQRLALASEAASRSRFIKRLAKLGIGAVILLGFAVLMVGADSASALFGNVLNEQAVVPAIVNGGAWSLTLLGVAVLNGLHRARRAAGVMGLGGFMQGIGMGLGYATGHGVEGALWGLTAGSACAMVWAGWSLLAAHHITMHGNAQPHQDPNARFWSALAWNSLAAASVMPVTLAASSLIAHGPNGAEQLAAFHALEQLHQLAIFLPGILSQALLPALSLHLSQEPNRATRRVVRLALFLALCGTALALALSWNPGWLHQLIGNPALARADATHLMLMHAGLAVALSLMGCALLARGLYGFATCLNLLWASIFLGLGWVWPAQSAADLQLARLYASWTLICLSATALWLLSPSARNRS